MHSHYHTSIPTWCFVIAFGLCLLLVHPPALTQSKRTATWDEQVAQLGIRSVPGRVKSSVAKTYFLREGGGCPNPNPGCRRSAYLVGGDQVVVMLYEGNRPRYVRVLYRAKGDGPMTAGIIAAADLEIDEEAKPVRPAALVGNWLAYTRPDNRASINLRQQGADLIVSFSVEIIEKDGTPVRDAPFRMGEARVRLTSDPYLTVTEVEGSSCSMFLVPIGRYLLVHDDGGRCADGGNALTVTGLYVREGDPPSLK